jgi:hypothetical protein
MYSALGHENPHPNQEAQRNYDKVLEEIEEMEELLSEPYEEENK